LKVEILMNKNPIKPSEKTVHHLRHFETNQIYEDKSDQEIWNTFNKGDEMAFNYIYRSYVQDLYRYGWQYSKDEDLVKDCIQNVFIYLRKRGHLAEVTNLRGYLYKCVRSEIAKNRKNEARFISIEEDYPEDSFLIEISPETTLIHRESMLHQQELISKSLNQLTPKQRKALLLFYEDGLSYKEISTWMDLSEVSGESISRRNESPPMPKPLTNT
jgi:RNA polymerase sigma factor (sigma-70 family)